MERGRAVVAILKFSDEEYRLLIEGFIDFVSWMPKNNLHTFHVAMTNYYLNLGEFGNAREHAVHQMSIIACDATKNHAYNRPLKLLMHAIAGHDAAFKDVAETIMSSIEKDISWISSLWMIAALLFLGKHDLLTSTLGPMLVGNGVAPYMDQPYKLSSSEPVSLITDFSKAIVKGDLANAKRLADKFMKAEQKSSWGAFILTPGLFTTMTMTGILIHLGIDCGAAGKIYSEWQAWIEKLAPKSRIWDDDELHVLPPQNDDAIMDELAVLYKRHGGILLTKRAMHVDVGGYPEDISYAFTTIENLLDLRLEGWFSADGFEVPQAEGGFKLRFEEVFGEKLPGSGLARCKLGDVLNPARVIQDINSRDGLQLFLKDVATNSNVFTVEQPDDKNGSILQALRHHLPSEVVEKIVCWASNKLGTCVAFEPRELNDLLIPAMEKVVREPANDDEGETERASLDSYIKEKLDRLLGVARKASLGHEDTILLIIGH